MLEFLFIMHCPLSRAGFGVAVEKEIGPYDEFGYDVVRVREIRDDLNTSTNENVVLVSPTIQGLRTSKTVQS